MVLADSETQLRHLIRNGRGVLVAGTGVSMAASSHPQASWTGLLTNGIEWLKEHKLMEADVAAAQLKLLEKKPQTHRFISAADDIVDDMGGAQSKHFARWLRRTVGEIRARNSQLLDALHALRRHGHLLATTNYDGLLLGEPPTLDAVTWQDTDELLGTVRQWDTEKILFLHGYWLKPRSVILDWTSYERIARDERYRQDLAAFWKTQTWIYVGCGVDGLSDPDFGLLLERYGERARRAGHWDYCLVRGQEQRQEFQAHFDNLKLNIRAVSYGEDYDALAQFLRTLLPEPKVETPPTPTEASTAVVVPKVEAPSIPVAPAFYAEPDYIGSHRFVGRQAELDALNDWANASDPTHLLLFEAIGGNGKSMLTWEWATRHAPLVRPDWAGRFWYSFYERGAIMQDFCQRALAYMTGRPLKEFRRRKTAGMQDELIAQLHARPWLLILDGLERVLVAYHRIDAAEVPDEEVDDPTDKVLDRNPCDAIRDEDTDLLRALAACAPSKILVSSRLTPRVLLNPAGQPIPGAHRITLSGLRPADAEQLLRSCGVSGDGAAMRSYLRQNCDNHPLVIGILAGLINEPGPNRGDFDAWRLDPDGGAGLNLAKLDLVQRRNHILRAAIDVLPDAGRELLSVLALLSESVDYEALEALYPDTEGRGEDSDETRPRQLAETIRDLEQRGLLQYDRGDRHYDLHPVVRGVAAGGMENEDKERYGQHVLDYFSSQVQGSYDKVETLEDVKVGMHLVRTHIKLGAFSKAIRSYKGGLISTATLSVALRFNLEAFTEMLSLLRPFFPRGWGELPEHVTGFHASYLATDAAIALRMLGAYDEGLRAQEISLQTDLHSKRWSMVRSRLTNLVGSYEEQNQLAKASRIIAITLELAIVNGDRPGLFKARLGLLEDYCRHGKWQLANEKWPELDAMGRNWGRDVYGQGAAEGIFAVLQLQLGSLQEEHLSKAENLARKGSNRTTLRFIYFLRGQWRLEQQQYAQAVASFQQAVGMARERHLEAAAAETGLVLAKFHTEQLTADEARNEAVRLAKMRWPAHRYLALLYLAIGDTASATHHALQAYRWAWADGEPYVHRYELNQTTELLRRLKVPVPELPPYDPALDTPFAWEAEVRAAIEELRATKAAKSPKEG